MFLTTDGWSYKAKYFIRELDSACRTSEDSVSGQPRCGASKMAALSPSQVKNEVKALESSVKDTKHQAELLQSTNLLKCCVW